MLVAYCKKNSRELHRVKREEVNHQTENRIGKNNDLRERQQHKSIDSSKYSYWLNQKFYSPQFCNTPKKTMDSFDGNGYQYQLRNCKYDYMHKIYQEYAQYFVPAC